MHELVARLIDIVRTDGERWQAIAAMDRALIARQPEPGEWSALECLVHAADTEAAVFAARCRAILTGEPTLRPYDPDVEGTPITPDLDPVALADRLAADRLRSVELLQTISDADLGRTSRHLELGAVTLEQLLNEWAAHDLMHIVQAERALMQPFIPGSGPWRTYFTDHDVEVSPATPS